MGADVALKAFMQSNSSGYHEPAGGLSASRCTILSRPAPPRRGVADPGSRLEFRLRYRERTAESVCGRFGCALPVMALHAGGLTTITRWLSQRVFRRACYELAERTGGTVTEFRFAEDVTPNFDQGIITYQDQVVTVVCVRDSMLFALAKPRVIDTVGAREVGPLTFVDLPDLVAALAALHLHAGRQRSRVA